MILSPDNKTPTSIDIPKFSLIENRKAISQNYTGLFQVTTIFAILGVFLIFLKNCIESNKQKDMKNITDFEVFTELEQK